MTPEKSKGIGWILLFIGFLFNVLETWYFGWNLKPQSVPEAYCDGLSDLILFLGLVYIAKGIFFSNITIRGNAVVTVVRAGDELEQSQEKNEGIV
jgi:vacuolar-type H+-ATPase subunit I/STV1